MSDIEHIPYFIHEDIYLVKEDNAQKTSSEQTKYINQEQTMEMQENISLSYEGKNLEKILVLTSNEKAEFLAENEKIFLGKVLHALQFNFEDIAIVNMAKINNSSFHKINHFDCRYMISFGVINEQLITNNKTPLYEVKKHEGVTFLLADELITIERDQNKKRRLWEALKQMF